MRVGGVFLPLAFAAGFASFISPCVLPLVPGYVSAVVGGNPAAQGTSRRALIPSLLFLAGFLAVFMTLGASASALGSALAAHRDQFNIAAGLFVATMGVLMIGDIALTGFGIGRAGNAVQQLAASRGGPVALGIAFAFCWTPCIGPVLGSILVLAGAKLTLAQGVLLLLVYGLGLALPFLLVSVAFTRAMRSVRMLRRFYRPFQAFAGLVLVAMGFLLATNQLYIVNIYAQHLLERLHLNWWNSL
ncbi:MAG: cytochrome c biogenesis CcdA family protein [Gaiellales bacterium]